MAPAVTTVVTRPEPPPRQPCRYAGGGRPQFLPHRRQHRIPLRPGPHGDEDVAGRRLAPHGSQRQVPVGVQRPHQPGHQRDPLPRLHQAGQRGPVVHVVPDVGREPGRRADRTGHRPAATVRLPDDPGVRGQFPQRHLGALRETMVGREGDIQDVRQQVLAGVTAVGVRGSGREVDGDRHVHLPAVERGEQIRRLGLHHVHTQLRKPVAQRPQRGRQQPQDAAGETADGHRPRPPSPYAAKSARALSSWAAMTSACASRTRA